MEDIKAQTRTFIVDNFFMRGDDRAFKDGDSFIDKRMIDSTGFLELVTFLEERFRIVVKDVDMIPENLDSLNNIAMYIERKLALVETP
jgi:acyl carrier protein